MCITVPSSAAAREHTPRGRETVSFVPDGVCCATVVQRGVSCSPLICQVNKTLATITQARINQPCMQISMLVQVRLVEQLMELAGG